MRSISILGLLALVACAERVPAASSENNDTATASCDARDFGAKGDGVTNDTVAIQKAIDMCAEVHLKSGTFSSGMLRLKSALTLNVHADAVLKGTQNDADYPDTHPATDNSQLSNCRKAFLYAEGVHDLHITGGGVIDGNGTPAKWLNSPEATRPMAMFIVVSDKVTIDSVTVKNSAMWTLVTMDTDNVVIRNVTVDSTTGSTRDGIDIVDGHHVLIEGCTISSEDDSFCIKSGSARGVDDVTVRNSHVRTSGVANAMKLGTASYGGFSNITFDTIDAQHADKAAMAVESVDGSPIQNIVFKNITYHDVGTPFFALIGDRGVRPAGVPRRIGSIDGIHFEHITGDTPRHEWGSIVSGLVKDGQTYPISNVTFDDVHIAVKGGLGSIPGDPPEYVGQYPDPNLWGNVPAYGVFLRHVNGASFNNTTIDVQGGDARAQLHTSDVASLALPSSDVTFTLHTSVNQPALDPAAPSEFRIAGVVSDPPTSNIPDPLGGWQGTGLVLTETAPGTLTGHAAFPQGAAVDLKATLRAGTAVRYERFGQGNRRYVIPSTPTAAIDLTWAN